MFASALYAGVALLALSGVVLATPPTALTANGPVFGFSTPFNTSSFRGIPFAVPPVGNLRFQAPQALQTQWTEPYNATVFGSQCMQRCEGKLPELMCSPTMSEDCLYLNVYTPSLSPATPAPVIVFIHGGSFQWGTGGAELYDGSKWAAEENIVLVTINYRLNIFGSLTTSAVAGNYGIQDQRRALEWVHWNIGFFGGDATRVTVSGQSAGATSTGIHLTSPESYPYFQRAAIISDPYGLIPPTKEMALVLGNEVLSKTNCTTTDSAAQLRCLRALTATELVDLAYHTKLPQVPAWALASGMVWCPHVDGTIVPQQPLQAMRTGEFSPVPLYIGTVANESVPFVYGLADKPLTGLDAEVLISYMLGIDAALGIRNVYGPPPSTGDARPYVSRAITDYLFYCPAHAAASLASTKNGNRTHVYFFDLLPNWPLELFDGNRDAPCVEYICHAFDLPTIFGTQYLLPPRFPRATSVEQNLTTFIQHAWAVFAANGSIGGWPTYESPSYLVYNLSALPTVPLRDYRAPYCAYFDEIGYHRW